MAVSDGAVRMGNAFRSDFELAGIFLPAGRGSTGSRTDDIHSTGKGIVICIYDHWGDHRIRTDI